MVAPVRETCAQALGVVLRHMSVSGVQGVLGVLLQLLSQKQWEVRHGGLLGLKYLLAVRKVRGIYITQQTWGVYTPLSNLQNGHDIRKWIIQSTQPNFKHRDYKCWLPGHRLSWMTHAIHGWMNAWHMRIYTTLAGPVTCIVWISIAVTVNFISPALQQWFT